jgi:hypothetical protein
MRADIHGGPEQNTLQSEAGYIDARAQSRQIDESLLQRTAAPYIRVKLRRLITGKALQVYPQQRKCLQTVSTAGQCQKPTMVDADDLPPKRLECLTRPAPRRGYLAGIRSPQRRSTEPTQHGQR